MKDEKEFIYCSQFNCPNTDCLRNREHQPFNVVTRQRRWKIKEDGTCDGEVYKDVK